MQELDEKVQAIKEWLGTGAINFFGRPFAGKDTQIVRLAKYLDASIIGGGDIIRNSDVPALIKEIVDRGELAPTEEYREIIKPYFMREEFKGRALLLSAVGRMHGEEPAIIQATTQAQHPIKAVIYIDINREEVFRRRMASPSRGRKDDTENKLSKRLEAYEEYTLPVLKTYEQMGLLVKIDGMQSEDAVFESLINALYSQST